MTQPPIMLQAHNLAHQFDTLLYQQVSFSLAAGQSMAILGISGSGKSSILNHLCTMLKPQEGVVSLLDVKDIYAQSPQDLIAMRRHHLGIIFQAHYLFSGFSALDNLKVASLLTHQEIPMPLLQTLQIDHILSQNVGSLSGGQQQRLSIARVLCKQPKIIFADEPTGNLDSQTARAVMENIFEYIQSKQAALVLATHDENLAKQCDFTYRLKDKRLELLASR